MEIFADHFYEKGHSHLVCQDYALSHVCKDYAFFIVADGCGSAANSEIGSMVISNAFKAAYENLWHNEFHIEIYLAELKKETLKRVEETRQALELNPESLYSTLLFGCLHRPSNTFHAAAWGDGLFIALFDDGSYEVVEIEYENNAPFYLYYDTSEASKKSYMQSCGGRSTMTIYKFSPGGARLYKDDYYEAIPDVHCFIHWYNRKDIKGIFALSDGIKSMNEHFLSAIPRCLDFKKINSTFIERRIKRFLKEKSKAGDPPDDDFSFAGIIKK